MKAVGIVAEYNPFHLGHTYHIQKTRQLTGSDHTPIVCVMSGSWVQRGECALTDKFTRARLALNSGADLILELPLPWAISSAESFAKGAVSTLEATGIVDTISFGSESGDLESIRALADALNDEGFQRALREELKKGKPFAEARQKAAERCIGARSGLLRGANDNLGVEYLRAAKTKLAALAVSRKGVSHDSAMPDNGFASASALRVMAREGNWAEFDRWVPEGTGQIIRTAGIAEMRWAERAILARLRTMDEDDFSKLPDSGAAEGLPDRLVKAAGEAVSLEQFYTLVKTRRYTHARIRRLALWAFLGMTAADRPDAPAYIRVLGMNRRGRELLHTMKKTASLPILTKPAHIRRMSDEARSLFSLESRGTDLFHLCFEQIKPCGTEYQNGPVVLS